MSDAPTKAVRVRRSRRVRIGTVVAVAWLLATVMLTVLLAPSIGARGWLWLGMHDVLCLIGCSHELWRAGRISRGHAP